MLVNAVVVTYNRCDLLKITLEKLINQTYKLNKIVVIDNASVDGTRDYLKTLNDNIFEIIYLEKNIGGAGGFHCGIKKAYELGCDYLWIMDDDTVCKEDALEKLMVAKDILKEKWGFLTSNVLFKDDKPCLMNIPTPTYVWNEYVEDGLINISHTSFVAMFIPADVVYEVGLPVKEYFIWGDDGDYSRRIASKYPGYLYSHSTVYHYMNENIGVDIFNTPEQRIDRFFYFYRNTMASFLRASLYEGFRFLCLNEILIIKILFSKTKFKFKKIFVVQKGLFCGFFMRYKIEYVEKICDE